MKKILCLLFKINLCWNVKCSFNGKCIDEGNKTRCACFTNHYGDDCSKQTETLQMNKNITAVTRIVAILTLSVFFLGVILLDYFKYIHHKMICTKSNNVSNKI